MAIEYQQQPLTETILAQSSNVVEEQFTSDPPKSFTIPPVRNDSSVIEILPDSIPALVSTGEEKVNQDREDHLDGRVVTETTETTSSNYTLSTQISVIDRHDSEHKPSFATTEQATLVARAQYIQEIARKMYPKINLRTGDAIKLEALNYWCRHPELDEGQVGSFIDRITESGKRKENAAWKMRFLPTIGLELEIPSKDLTVDHRKVLNIFGISNEPVDNNLLEVRTHFSQSWKPQAQVLHELADMNAIGLEGDREKHLPDNKMLSLHLNLGMTAQVHEALRDINQGSHIATLSDILTYIYTSPQRILGRKTNDATNIKKYNVVNDPTMGKHFVGRLELRPTEFRTYETYRLLRDAQMLGGMMFSSKQIKHAQQRGLPEPEHIAKPARLWDELYSKAGNYLNYYHRISPLLYDTDKEKAAHFMRTTTVKKDMREMINECIKKLRK